MVFRNSRCANQNVSCHAVMDGQAVHDAIFYNSSTHPHSLPCPHFTKNTDYKIFRRTALLTLYTPQQSKHLFQLSINKSKPTTSATNPNLNPNNQELSTMSDDGWYPTWRPFSGAHPRRWNSLEVYGHGPQRHYSHGMGGSECFYGNFFRQTPADARYSSIMSQGGYFGRAAPYDRAHVARFNRRNREREY
jgi:hypothetical protein